MAFSSCSSLPFPTSSTNAEFHSYSLELGVCNLHSAWWCLLFFQLPLNMGATECFRKLAGAEKHHKIAIHFPWQFQLFLQILSTEFRLSMSMKLQTKLISLKKVYRMQIQASSGESRLFNGLHSQELYYRSENSVLWFHASTAVVGYRQGKRKCSLGNLSGRAAI